MGEAKVTTGRALEARTPEARLTRALAAPFEAAEVKFKPQTVKDERALAVAYIDARLVMDRLDRVVGAHNWQDAYERLADGSVLCRLSLRVGGEWITKEDVGGESEQPDEHDRGKAAFSDALKRAAVKWGVGRYLYRLEKKWVGYDPKRRALTELPRLPEWALPPPPLGPELKARLVKKDAALAEAGRSKPGELIAAIREAGALEGMPAELAAWDEAGCELAVRVTKQFEAAHPQPKKEKVAS